MASGIIITRILVGVTIRDHGIHFCVGLSLATRVYGINFGYDDRLCVWAILWLHVAGSLYGLIIRCLSYVWANLWLYLCSKSFEYACGLILKLATHVRISSPHLLSFTSRITSPIMAVNNLPHIIKPDTTHNKQFTSWTFDACSKTQMDHVTQSTHYRSKVGVHLTTHYITKTQHKCSIFA